MDDIVMAYEKARGWILFGPITLGDKKSFVSLLACSLVGFWVGLGWLVLVYCERKTLLAGWFGLAETNQRTGRLIIQDIYMDFD